jgi:hypothetical protein
MIAAERALHHPLLDDVSIDGAKSALLHITGGPDCALFEVLTTHPNYVTTTSFIFPLTTSSFTIELSH